MSETSSLLRIWWLSNLLEMRSKAIRNGIQKSCNLYAFSHLCNPSSIFSFLSVSISMPFEIPISTTTHLFVYVVAYVALFELSVYAWCQYVCLSASEESISWGQLCSCSLGDNCWWGPREEWMVCEKCVTGDTLMWLEPYHIWIQIKLLLILQPARSWKILLFEVQGIQYVCYALEGHYIVGV